MPPRAALALIALFAVLLMMLVESQLARFNERLLRQRGAVEPPDDVYRIMAWAYPGMFVAMAIEGAIAGPRPGLTTLAGAGLFGAAKALKFWAIASLGTRWTFRVLVVPGAPLVRGGPYAWLRHPNYVAVLGEIIGVALLVGAPVTGLLALAGFGALLKKRIGVEERALGMTKGGRGQGEGGKIDD